MPTLSRRQWISIAAGGGLVVIVVGLVLALGGGDEEAKTAKGPDRATTTTERPTTTTTKAPEPKPKPKPDPVWPLSGRPMTNAAAKQLASRPALVVKIDNGDPASGAPGARPQVGINNADVVFEEMVEGSVTRFASVFHSFDANPVGPVRSARTTDLLIMSSLRNPLFAWSGANGEVATQVHAAPLVDVGYDAASDLYTRDSTRVAPYNLFSSTEALRSAAPDEKRPPPQLFRYRDTAQPQGGRKVNGVHINFGDGPGSAPVDFDWDGSGWARSQRATPHVDAAGERIAPPNVIIRFTPYEEVQCCDLAGFPIVEAQLQGSGRAWVLTGGELVYGRWEQPDVTKPAVYTDNDGRPIELSPGQTWVAIAPPGTASIH